MMFVFGAESRPEPVLGSGLVPCLGLLCLDPGLWTGPGLGLVTFAESAVAISEIKSFATPAPIAVL